MVQIKAEPKNKLTFKSLYRPEIDGLRALAVIAVIINHFSAETMPSGYLGVDIFFVISGYVITGSLTNHRSSKFSDFSSIFILCGLAARPGIGIICSRRRYPDMSFRSVSDDFSENWNSIIIWPIQPLLASQFDRIFCRLDRTERFHPYLVTRSRGAVLFLLSHFTLVHSI